MKANKVLSSRVIIKKTIRNKLNSLIIIFFGFMLTGCFGSPTPVPEDRFYTVELSKADIYPTKYKRITIKRVHAYGLYKERAMLYSSADLPLQIKRYHYHHWVMPPTQIIENGLKDYLIQSRISKEVRIQVIRQVEDISISAELMAFERVLQKGEQSVHLELEFEIVRPDGRQQTLKFTKDKKTKNDTLHAAAIAYGEVLSDIFKKLLLEL